MASAGTFDIRKWTTFLRGEREGGDRFNDSHPRLMLEWWLTLMMGFPDQKIQYLHVTPARIFFKKKERLVK